MSANSYLLFLDDYRNPVDCAAYMYRKGVDCTIYHKQWVVVRSYLQFIQWIQANGLPSFISFDHDLADVVQLKEQLDIGEWFDVEGAKEYTGLDCAKWLVSYCIDTNQSLPEFAVHSANPAGCENIQGLLKSFINHQNKH